MNTIDCGRGVVLRYYHRSDLEPLVQQFGDPSVMRGVRGFVWRYGKKNGKRFLTEKLRQYRRIRPVTKPGEIESIAWAITVRGNFAGGIGLKLSKGKAEIGYWLGRRWRGRGIMTRTVRTFSAYAHRRFSLVRLEAKAFPFNRASTRVLTKCGFKYEGTLRKNHFAKGKYLDDRIFAKVW